MFAKLNKQLQLSVPNLDVIINRFGATKSDGSFGGIAYYDIDPEMTQYLKDALIPVEYHSEFEVNGMLINEKNIPPHTDSDTLTSINIYVKTAKAVTKFYNVKYDDLLVEKLKTQTDGKIYSFDQIEEDSSFIAEPGDIWVLDVKRPHSVHCYVKENRYAYVVQSDSLNFQQVKEILGID